MHNDDPPAPAGNPDDGISFTRPAITRLAIVSCTGPTRPSPARARDLFTAPLFQELCAFAERESDRWFLLSAEHGLLEPDVVIAPSDTVLERKAVAARQAWSARVIAQLTPHLPGVGRILVLANARSREFLLDFLREDGREVEIPLDGMSLGRQLQWLRARNGGRHHDDRRGGAT